MIGHDIAAALPELRAHAESRMVDTVRVTTPGSDTWDDATGTYTPGAATVHYTGKARIRQGNPAPGATDAGETAWAVDRAVLSLPVALAVLPDGADVEVTAVGSLSASVVGQRYTVLGSHSQTDSTARRYVVQVVTRDA